jgi:hypothetical protein
MLTIAAIEFFDDIDLRSGEPLLQLPQGLWSGLEREAGLRPGGLERGRSRGENDGRK